MHVVGVAGPGGLEDDQLEGLALMASARAAESGHRYGEVGKVFLKKEDDAVYKKRRRHGGNKKPKYVEGEFRHTLPLARSHCLLLPPNRTEIEEYTISGCTLLSEIALPPNHTEIGDGAFVRCTSLRDRAAAWG